VRKRQSSTRSREASGARGTSLPPARRRFGQNFLTSPGAIARIVEALDPAESERVVEIGPGRGALTDALLARVPHLDAIELDRDLAAFLRQRHPESRLRVIEGDVLEVPLGSIGPGPLVVVGNLPYNISKPFAMKLVTERARVARAVLMFQREVASRLTARPATSAYGPLTVLAGRAYAITRLFDLPPGAFRPPPEVTSTVTCWRRRPPEDLPDEIEAPLREVLHAAFGRRRQTILRNLRDALPGGDEQAGALLHAAGIDGRLRAEAVGPEAFVALARVWPGRARQDSPPPV
jgi:16S rRNA (adenine1518-N6/adenine1519-N6)-dimethyltransferase